MTSDAERLLASPDQHFLAFDRDQALFLPMDREAYCRSSFLDRRAQGLAERPSARALDPLIAAAKQVRTPQAAWIFHLAHCGSTLLSRLIDGVRSSLVLREPPPLRQLGLAGAAGERSSSWRDRLQLAHAMAARRFDPAKPTVVKANVPVNFILDDLLRIDPAAPAVVLYLPLEAYLLAILRSDQHRIWVERISDQLADPLSQRTGLNRGAPMPERAAALWLYQLLAFQAVLDANPAAASLDAGQLFAAPANVGAAVATHLGVTGVDIEANATALAGHYAKDPSKPYDELERQRRADENRVRLADELSAARRWIDQCVAASELRLQLDRPLTGAAPELLV